MTEERIVNTQTGGEKGRKPARFDLLPAKPLWEIAEVFGYGASKYEDRNWERGYDWSLSFGAMMRHAWAFWGGEDVDPESGKPHMAHVGFHCLALLEFMEKHREMDDRAGERLEPASCAHRSYRIAWGGRVCNSCDAHLDGQAS